MMIDSQMRLKQEAFGTLNAVKDLRNQGGRSSQRLKIKNSSSKKMYRNFQLAVIQVDSNFI